MIRSSAASFRAALVVLAASAALAGCSSPSKIGVARVKLSERECMARAMYFESNRSSDAGMLAVGTVVMNRVKSGRYGSNVCEVVGAPRQFAPGVLSRPMNDRGAPRARRMADIVLSGKRHPGVQNAQFFHTAGYKFPYRNMRYVLVAGGNAFYDKTQAPKTWYGGEGRWGPPPPPSERIDGSIMVAKVEVVPDEPAAAARGTSVGSGRGEAHVALAARRSLPENAAHRPDAAATYGGIPAYEPAPGSRPASTPARSREIVVASLDAPDPAPSARRGAAIREDNGLREEDRWRDQELAEEAGKAPATDESWRERRERPVESAPLPVIEAEPEPQPRVARSQVAPRPAPVRIQRAPVETYETEAPIAAAEPTPSRGVRVAARQPRTVEPRASRPVAADPAALGWQVGAQPVRAARDEADFAGYQPLSTAGSEYGARTHERRAPARRSYGGVDLD